MKKAVKKQYEQALIDLNFAAENLRLKLTLAKIAEKSLNDLIKEDGSKEEDNEITLLDKYKTKMIQDLLALTDNMIIY